jgi:NADH:ubiquinone oxidoreductase subunit F (NADH-binding)
LNVFKITVNPRGAGVKRKIERVQIHCRAISYGAICGFAEGKEVPVWKDFNEFRNLCRIVCW